MNNYQEEIILLCFTSYTIIPFKMEIYAHALSIEWGDGNCTNYDEKEYFNIEYIYQTEGEKKVKITGTNISYLNISHLNLTELTLEHCPTLEYLNCSGNELEVLDLETCKSLEELQCNSNNLKKLIIPQKDIINYINASYNILEKLEVTGCKSLHTLYCDNNKLNYLDITGCNMINEINISNNLLSSNIINKLFDQLPPKTENHYASICYFNNLELENCNRPFLRSKRWH